MQNKQNKLGSLVFGGSEIRMNRERFKSESRPFIRIVDSIYESWTLIKDKEKKQKKKNS